MTTVDEIRAALDAATQGEWKWHSVLAPYELPDTAISAGDLRVETPTPNEAWDSRIEFVIEAMKHGHVLMRKADADLIANAPAYLRHLLAELDRLRVIEGAARVAADMTVIPVGERTFGKVSVRVMGIRRVLRDALAAFDATKDSAT
jgi:hypothetical protein